MVGREELVLQLAGERRVASERRSETTVCGGESSSKVLGTNMQRLRPSATLAFFHLLPIFWCLLTLTAKMLQATQKREKAPPPDLKWRKASSFGLEIERKEMGFYEKQKTQHENRGR